MATPTSRVRTWMRWAGAVLLVGPLVVLWILRETVLVVPDRAAPCGPRAARVRDTLPERLSETGFFADLKTLTPAPGVFPYSVRYQLWSDGAAKQRHAFLPPGGVIDVDAAGTFFFPVGTAFVKTFSI